jgi:O-antigen ligase
VTGVGFGKPFYQPVQLPYIPGFGFGEFKPHNSIVWIWLKMGYLGFVTLLFIIAATIRSGTHAFLRLTSGNTLAVSVAGLAYVVMFVIFAYVDIIWAPQTALFLGVCIALCANIQRLAIASNEVIDPEDLEADFEAVEELAEMSRPAAR